MQTIISPTPDLTMTIYEDPQCFSPVGSCLKSQLGIVQTFVVKTFPV